MYRRDAVLKIKNLNGHDKAIVRMSYISENTYRLKKYCTNGGNIICGQNKPLIYLIANDIFKNYFAVIKTFNLYTQFSNS